MSHTCLPGNHRGRRPLESFLLEESVSSLQNRRFGIFIVLFHRFCINTLLFNSIVNTAHVTFIPIRCTELSDYFLLILH